MICEYIKMKTDIQYGGNININNIELKNRNTMFPYKGIMIANNEQICEVEGHLDKDDYQISVKSKDNQYIIKFWEQNSNIGTISSITSMMGQMLKDKSLDAMYETMQPKIFDANNQQIGEFQWVSQKAEGTMQSYYYRKLVINNVELNCYEIGKDDQSILFCIYDSKDNMIATVSKRMQIQNGKSRYTMYIINEDWFEYVALITVMMHQLNYEDEDGKGLGKVKQSLHTHQKELLSKYKEDFIPRIIEQDGEENLPDNMPLVAEKVKESQHTIGLNMNRIMTIIFIVGFIALLIYLFLGK